MTDNCSTNTTRRRFLHLSGTVAAGMLAGCSGKTPSSQPTSDTQIPSTANTTTVDETTEGTETTSKQTLQTKYNSREQYSSPGTEFDNFEGLSRWQRVQGSVLADTTQSVTGSQSLKLVGKSGHHAVANRTLSSPMDFSNHDLSVAFRSKNPDVVALLVYLFDSDDNWAVLELRSVTYRSPDIGWFRTSPGVFATSDTNPDLTNIERIEIEITNASDGDAVSWVDDMRLHPKPDTGYVVLSWDDGNRSYYEQAAPVHDRFNFPAVLTMPVYPRKTADSFFMSIKELHERQNAGDEVVAHGSTNEPFAEISTSQLDTLLKRNKKWLLDNGFEGADFIVYPGNNFDKGALKVISKYHYMGGMNQSGNVNTTGVYGFDPLVLPRTIGHDIDICKRAVNLAADHRQCTILNFHHFNSKNTMDISDYEELLAHIDQTNGIEAIGFTDLWEMRRTQP
ncbi:polysaccharide deacetylase family protein [Haladaptatus pallidirubidus]